MKAHRSTISVADLKEVAARLIAHHGFFNTKLSGEGSICEEAGVSPKQVRAVYKPIKRKLEDGSEVIEVSSKELLYADVLNDILNNIRTRILYDVEADQDLPIEQRLEALFHTMIRYCDSNRDHAAIILGNIQHDELAVKTGLPVRLLGDIFESCKDVTAGLQDEYDINPDDLYFSWWVVGIVALVTAHLRHRMKLIPLRDRVIAQLGVWLLIGGKREPDALDKLTAEFQSLQEDRRRDQQDMRMIVERAANAESQLGTKNEIIERQDAEIRELRERLERAESRLDRALGTT